MYLGWLSFVNRTSIIATSMDKNEEFNNATVAATLAKDIRIVAEKARNRVQDTSRTILYVTEWYWAVQQTCIF